MTQMISLKMKESILKDIDKTVKEFNFSNRTDFIRDAIREKLEEYNKERSLNLLKRYYGAFKGKSMTDEEFEKKKEEALNEYIKERGFKL